MNGAWHKPTNLLKTFFLLSFHNLVMYFSSVHFVDDNIMP